MARVKFYLDIRGVKAGNSAPLKIKITSKGIAGYIPLDIRLSPSQWNDRKDLRFLIFVFLCFTFLEKSPIL